MDIRVQRAWMYNKLLPGRVGLTPEFMQGVEYFLYMANQLDCLQNEGKIRCPCSKHKNHKFLSVEEVRVDLYQKGFKPDYWYWTSHGEIEPHSHDQITFHPDASTSEPPDVTEEHVTTYEEMVFDVANQNQLFELTEQFIEEPPNKVAQDFYNMLSAAQRPLWEGCTSHTELSVVVRMMSIKTDNNISREGFDQFASLLKETNPDNNLVPPDFYRTKKMLSKLGLEAKKIDCCPNSCMLYFKDDAEATDCKYCGSPRYKSQSGRQRKQKLVPWKRLYYLPLIPRLQRLFASKQSAEHMRWHHENKRTTGVMCHPSDAEAWKHFDLIHPTFASEPRNVRLGLCSDGFTPYSNSASPYSCWPVMVTPYNLPPEMCMTLPYIFLTMIIPGPKNPKSKIDVFLQPLIDELKVLWEDGVITYDVSRKHNFQMRAALLWTIGDFPAYDMLSGWSTAGKLACPHCMESTKAFTLKHGGKNSWFDCHRRFLPANHTFRRNKDGFIKNRVEKSAPPPCLTGHQIWERVCMLPNIIDQPNIADSKLHNYGVTHNWTKCSIFWNLPYWHTNLIRHNLDLMHIEKNVFDNIFNTVMDIRGKTKDNIKARMDLKEYCRRKDLELIESNNGNMLKPKAKYALTLDQKRVICEWIKGLRMPDGYASNLSRCVDIRNGRLIGMKSHDCHVFMECLLPLAFISLPESIWGPITELSQFFKELCSAELRVDALLQSEANIPVILCKLERIFPPGFFDSMEHLPIHLPYEARIGGPVQYRWMYPFERFLNKIKKTVKNKARVEGSICEAYLAQETSQFCSYYFDENVQCSQRRVNRNDEGDTDEFRESALSIFKSPGRAAGHSSKRYLSDSELATATLYAFMNCAEVETFIE